MILHVSLVTRQTVNIVAAKCSQKVVKSIWVPFRVGSILWVYGGIMQKVFHNHQKPWSASKLCSTRFTPQGCWPKACHIQQVPAMHRRWSSKCIAPGDMPEAPPQQHWKFNIYIQISITMIRIQTRCRCVHLAELLQRTQLSSRSTKSNF